MKGATHNMVVRTRTDVALYVLNHKRGHLRDLESSFKVTLAVIADASITGQQSFRSTAATSAYAGSRQGHPCRPGRRLPATAGRRAVRR